MAEVPEDDELVPGREGHLEPPSEVFPGLPASWADTASAAMREVGVSDMRIGGIIAEVEANVTHPSHHYSVYQLYGEPEEFGRAYAFARDPGITPATWRNVGLSLATFVGFGAFISAWPRALAGEPWVVNAAMLIAVAAALVISGSMLRLLGSLLERPVVAFVINVVMATLLFGLLLWGGDVVATFAPWPVVAVSVAVLIAAPVAQTMAVLADADDRLVSPHEGWPAAYSKSSVRTSLLAVWVIPLLAAVGAVVLPLLF